MNPLVEYAWDLYVQETKGAISAVDNWEQLGPHAQVNFLEKAAAAMFSAEIKTPFKIVSTSHYDQLWHGYGGKKVGQPEPLSAFNDEFLALVKLLGLPPLTTALKLEASVNHIPMIEITTLIEKGSTAYAGLGPEQVTEVFELRKP